MHVEYVQHLRHKLQKRFRRLNSAGHQTFHVMLKQFWAFLYSQPIFVGILDDLAKKFTDEKATADKIHNGEHWLGTSESEHAAISFFVVGKCVEFDSAEIEMHIAQGYNVFEVPEQLDFFRETFVEPIYEYPLNLLGIWCV